MINSSANGNCEQKALLNQIRAHDFAAIEAVLYLDAYASKEALDSYLEITATADELKKKYESNYGPLTSFGVSSENTWTWVETPWPWELEAN